MTDAIPMTCPPTNPACCYRAEKAERQIRILLRCMEETLQHVSELEAAIMVKEAQL